MLIAISCTVPSIPISQLVPQITGRQWFHLNWRLGNNLKGGYKLTCISGAGLPLHGLPLGSYFIKIILWITLQEVFNEEWNDWFAAEGDSLEQ
jgi:hypothetical protein